jgi:hypothetical protein
MPLIVVSPASFQQQSSLLLLLLLLPLLSSLSRAGGSIPPPRNLAFPIRLHGSFMRVGDHYPPQPYGRQPHPPNPCLSAPKQPNELPLRKRRVTTTTTSPCRLRGGSLTAALEGPRTSRLGRFFCPCGCRKGREGPATTADHVARPVKGGRKIVMPATGGANHVC